VGNGKKNLNSGKIENYGCELEAACQLNAHWRLNTNHSLLKMKERDVAAAPKYKGFAGANYHQGPWNVVAGLQYLSGVGLDADGDGFADLTGKDICLVNATVNYQLTRNVGLWLRGENLLAQSYEINYGYPMPRATFMAGVTVGI
jgi:iron complex outermembrane receptor protein